MSCMYYKIENFKENYKVIKNYYNSWYLLKYWIIKNIKFIKLLFVIIPEINKKNTIINVNK